LGGGLLRGKRTGSVLIGILEELNENGGGRGRVTDKSVREDASAGLQKSDLPSEGRTNWAKGSESDRKN